MATDACVKPVESKCRGCFVEATDRGQRYEDGESRPSQAAGLANLHAVSAIWSGLCCDSSAALRVWKIPWGMGSGCGGVSRMGWCRDGGGGDDDDGGGGVDDGGGQPCLDWLPSLSLDSDPLSRRSDCADACGPSPNSSRANGLARVCLMSGRRGRGRDAWNDVCPPVAALGTKSWGRSCGPGDGR
jgi:hypothetical protein